jgi:hypothetical protein
VDGFWMFPPFGMFHEPVLRMNDIHTDATQRAITNRKHTKEHNKKTPKKTKKKTKTHKIL